MKRYTMQYRDPGGGYNDDTDPHVREDSRGAWVEAEPALAAIAVRDMRIAYLWARIRELEAQGDEWEARTIRAETRCCELEARVRELTEQLAEGADIILALTGREPVLSAGGEIVGFVEAEVRP